MINAVCYIAIAVELKEMTFNIGKMLFRVRHTLFAEGNISCGNSVFDSVYGNDAAAASVVENKLVSVMSLSIDHITLFQFM